MPTAELEPITESYVKSDEADMRMTYDELTIFGRLRKIQKWGPYGMFQRSVGEWNGDRPRAAGHDAPTLEPLQVAEKLKDSFQNEAFNRHKMATIPPIAALQ